MPSQLARLSECVAITGLNWDELVLGAQPSKLHDRLRRFYLKQSRQDRDVASSAIVAQIRAALDFGEKKTAADLLIALRKILGSSEERKATRTRAAGRAPAPRRSASA